MKQSTTSDLGEIDWPNILGPILSGMSRDELADLAAATFQHSRRAIRLQAEILDMALPFETEPVPWFETGRFIKADQAGHAPRPGAFLQHVVGDYYIQDAGSMLALALCDVKPGQWVCDTCAAPGGKSTALLAALNGQGLLVANEVIRSRLSILQLAVARAGYGNQLLTNLEIEGLRQACGREFDCVLVDAPCTGQTMVARGKQSMAAFSPAQIEHSSLRQQRILRAAAGLVKPGGRLVYATCAFSYAENEQIVQRFLNECNGWKLAPVAGLEAWQSPIAEGCYRVWPHRDDCAGAFAARLINEADERTNLEPNCPPARLRKNPWHATAGLPSEIAWLSETETALYFQSRDQLHRFCPSTPASWLAVAVSGTHIAEQHGPRWKPAFDSAVLKLGLTASQTIQLDDTQAIRYAAGEAVRPDAPLEVSAGNWCVATWDGRALSWGKITQGQLKNHFPKALRQANLVTRHCGP